MSTDIGIKNSDETKKLLKLFPERGVFLTGIESSDPWVEGKRRNQLIEAHNFHEHWEKRLENIKSLGISWLRYGPPYSQVHIGKNQYDFSLTEKVIKKSKALGIELVIDLLHFGLPEWLHSENPEEPFFQNPAFPFEFATYVGYFVRTFPEIRYFTLINEPYITASFSTKHGIWNEAKRNSWNDDSHFLNAVRNIARAAVLAKEEIERIWENEKRSGFPVFIQNESFEVAIAENTDCIPEVEAFNVRRFAPLDLIFGHRDESMKKYMESHGLTEIDYEWFMGHGNTRNTILGIDHYPTCVHHMYKNKLVDERADMPSRLAEVVKPYWHRYKLPMMHTEVNAWPQHALTLCQNTFDEINKLRKNGCPVLGMGWYGDEYQVGWHVALHGKRSFEESPVGLFYKGEIQPVGKLFCELAKRGLELNS